MIVHATSAARRVDGVWAGVLLFGPSGTGKSDLALRLLERGWRLVSDDQTRVWTSGGRLWGRAPETISGLIEARGVGVVPTACVGFARLDLAVLCQAEEPERLPHREIVRAAGLELPCVRLAATHASAVTKLTQALAFGVPALGAGPGRVYETPSRGAGPDGPHAGGAPEEV